MYKRFVVVDVFLGTYVDAYRRAVQAGWVDHVAGRSTWPSPPHCRFGFYSTPRCVVSGRDYSALSQRRRSLQIIRIRSFIVHYSITITVEIWTGCIVVVSLMLCPVRKRIIAAPDPSAAYNPNSHSNWLWNHSLSEQNWGIRIHIHIRAERTQVKRT